jgi:double-stranded uracil-DNA glycosylase
MAETPWKPTKEQIAAAVDKTLPDIIDLDLDVLFTGINPGLYTAAIGHHFGRPGNRFWKVLHLSGFTPRQLSPFEEDELLEYRLGITNFVSRATAAATDLKRDEFQPAARSLKRKVMKYQPHILTVLGVQAYRTGFDKPKARVGEQPERIGQTRIWVLPNPSGLQAHYQLDDMIDLFSTMKKSL